MDPRTREPDPETMELLAALAAERRAWSAQVERVRKALEAAVRKAKEDGHSYSQIQNATGLSLGAVQRIVK